MGQSPHGLYKNREKVELRAYIKCTQSQQKHPSFLSGFKNVSWQADKQTRGLQGSSQDFGGLLNVSAGVSDRYQVYLG